MRIRIMHYEPRLLTVSLFEAVRVSSETSVMMQETYVQCIKSAECFLAALTDIGLRLGSVKGLVTSRQNISFRANILLRL